MTKRKGIILAGGAGTRLLPLTRAVSKQLLPVYDKPMIYYPLSTLMSAGIREIAIITTPGDQAAFQALLGDGSRFGLSLDYIAQPSPDGLAQAYLLAEAFLDGRPSALVLGDNIFHGPDFASRLIDANVGTDRNTVFTYPVGDPHRFGVLTLDARGNPRALEEKPARPRSNLAVTGLYFLDAEAPALARGLRPSARGELEITDLLSIYLARGTLSVTQLESGCSWFDTGTHESLRNAAERVRQLDIRHGVRLGAVEALAFEHGWIDQPALARIAAPLAHTRYGAYLAARAGLAKTATDQPAAAVTSREPVAVGL